MSTTHIVSKHISLGSENEWWVPSLPVQRLCELFPPQASGSHLLSASYNSSLQIMMVVVSFPIIVFYVMLLYQFKAGLNMLWYRLLSVNQ